jgi:hypothetical protein
MKTAAKDAIILSAAFIVIALSSMITLLMTGKRMKAETAGMAGLIGLVGTGILALVAWIAKIGPGKGNSSDENLQIFELSPAKRCAPGPYMRSSDPGLQALCKHVPEKAITQVSCAKGFPGRPVHFEYTGLSDAKWSNPINCSRPSWNYPCPL